MKRRGAGALAIAIAVGIALLAWMLVARMGANDVVARPSVSDVTPGPETLTVEWLPRLQQPGSPVLQPLSKSTHDLALIGTMRDDILALPGWPKCGNEFCVFNCPNDFGVNYDVSILRANGSVELTADLDPDGCQFARIVLGRLGWARVWPAWQVNRRAPLTAPVWADIAHVLDLPLCDVNAPRTPGPVACVGIIPQSIAPTRSAEPASS